jgi:hypothetical protein
MSTIVDIDTGRKRTFAGVWAQIVAMKDGLLGSLISKSKAAP